MIKRQGRRIGPAAQPVVWIAFQTEACAYFQMLLLNAVAAGKCNHNANHDQLILIRVCQVRYHNACVLEQALTKLIARQASDNIQQQAHQALLLAHRTSAMKSDLHSFQWRLKMQDVSTIVNVSLSAWRCAHCSWV